MPLLSYALTNLADVKESLGITAGDTSKDNLITRKINQATEMIEAYCQLARDHHFASTTYTNEEYDGTGINQISLKMRPVITLSSFQYRNTTENINSWTEADSDLYFIDLNSGVIDLLWGQTRDWNRYRVTYTAGFSTIPSDLAEACVTLAGYLVENSATGTSVKRKREGAREIEYFAPATTDTGSLIGSLGLDNMLGRYINYALYEDK